MSAILQQFRLDKMQAVFGNDIGSAEITNVDGTRVVRLDSLGDAGLDLTASTPLTVKTLERRMGHIGAFAKMSPTQRKDALENFVTSSLSQVLPRSENVMRPSQTYIFTPGPGRSPVLPSRNLVKPGLRTVEYEVRAQTGNARFGDPASSREFENADYVGERMVNGAEWYGIRYGYTIPQTWEDGYLGGDLMGERERSAAKALDDLQEQVSGWGDPDRKLPGLLAFHGGIYTIGGQTFSSGSVSAVDQLAAIAAWESLYMRANSDRMPSGVILPDRDRARMIHSYITGTSDSVWEKAQELHPWMRNATFTNRLNQAGVNSAGRWVLYNAEDETETYFENTPTMVFGPWVDEMRTSFLALRRTGGLVAKVPERIMTIDFTA